MPPGPRGETPSGSIAGKDRRITGTPLPRTLQRPAAVNVDILKTKYKQGWNKCIWKPRIATVEEKEKGMKLVKEYGNDPMALATARRLRDFCNTFLLINNFETLEAGIDALIGQMSADGLKAGTLAQYIRTMVRGRKDLGARVSEALRALDRMHADSDTQHAVDTTKEEVLSIISQLRKQGSPLEAAAVELMLKTGLRMKDLHRLRRKQLRQNKKKMVVIEVRRAKNRSKKKHRATAMFPPWFGPVAQQTIQLFEKGQDQDTKPFLSLNATALNKAVSGICTTKLTSYSFRRAFIHRALKETDYDFKVCAEKYTLHRDPEILRAYYMQDIAVL